MPRNPLYKTSTPLVRRTRQNTVPGPNTKTHYSSLPPSSPYLQNTSDPVDSASVCENTQQPHTPASQSRQDPFGFLTVEKYLKDRRKSGKRPVLQSRMPSNEAIRSILRSGDDNLSPGADFDAESDGRPAFATPVRKAATESSRLSSLQLSPAPEGSVIDKTKRLEQGTKILASQTSVASRLKQRKRTTKAKSHQSEINSRKLSEDRAEKENVFAPSSDYFDSLPRHPTRRTAAGTITRRSSRVGKGKVQSGSSKPKSARDMKKKDRNKQKLADIAKGIGNDEEEDRPPKRVGESFVFDGEEREVKGDRRFIFSSLANLPGRILSDMKPIAKHAVFTSRR